MQFSNPSTAESVWQHLLDAIRDPSVILRADLSAACANKAYALHHGIPSPDDLIGRSVYDYVSPEHLVQAAQRLKRLLKGEPVSPDVFVSCTEDELRYTEVTFRPIVYEDAPAIHLILRDVTDYHSIKQELMMNEHRLQTLVSAAPVILFATDEEGKITTSEGQGLVALGLRQSNLMGEHFTSFCKGGEELFRQALSGLVVQDVLEVRGQLLDTYLAPIMDRRKAKGVIGVATNVTKQVQTHKCLAASEERFRRLTEAFSHTIWTADPKGQVHSSTDHWTQFTGQSVEAAQGQGWTEMIYPDDTLLVLRLWEKAVRLQKPCENDFRLVTPRGIRWAHVRAVPVFNADGTLREWIGTLTDVTAEQQAQDELTQRIELEQVLNRSLTNFLAAPPEHIDNGIEYGLKSLSEYLGAERGFLLLFEEAEGPIVWTKPGLVERKPLTKRSLKKSLCELGRRIQEDGCVYASTDDEALNAGLRRELEPRGVRSFLGLPVARGDDVIGMLGFDALSANVSWPKEMEAMLKEAGKMFVVAVDRRAAQLALKESKTSFANLVDSHPDPILIVARETIQYANTAAARLFGLADPGPMIGQNPAPWIISSGDFNPIEPQATKAPVRYQFKVKGKRGQVPVSGFAVRTMYNGMEAAHVVLTDLTDRQKREQQLELLVKAIRQVGDSVVMADRWGCIKYVNDSFYQTYRYNDGEVADRLHITDLFAEGLSREDLKPLLLEEPGEVWAKETPHRRQDGSVFPADVTLTITRDGRERATGIVAIIRDVTERYTLQEHVRKANERYQTFIETTTEAISRYELDAPMPLGLSGGDQALYIWEHARLVEYNDMYALGAPSGALPDKLQNKRLADHPPQVQAGNWAFVEAFARDLSLREFMQTFQDTKTGELRQVSINAVPIYNSAGRLDGVWCLHRDLSHIFANAKEITQAANQERIKLGHSIHNTLVQQLASLQNVLHRAMSHLGRKGGGEIVLYELVMASQIVTDATVETRGIMTGAVGLEMGRTGVLSVCESLAEATSASYRIEAAVEAGEPAKAMLTQIPQTDALYLVEIIRSAVSNAARHASPSRISLSIKDEIDYLSFEVADNGCGFDQDIIQRELQRRNLREGGLGIASMQMHARILGIEFSIDSRPDAGTRILFAYPKARLLRETQPEVMETA